MAVGRASMYSVTEALASTISGASSSFDGMAERDFDDGGGRESREGMEEEDDTEDAGSCGYNDAGSSIATFWKSSSRKKNVFEAASVLPSSIDSDASSNDSTL